MSDQKSWLWKRKSSEKSTIVNVTQNPPSKSNEEEMPIMLSEKAELEKDLKDLSDKLSIALSECNELAHENAKMAQEAITSWEKAEAHALSFKEELEEALLRKCAYEERSIQLEAALKECMQQLRFVRDEKEQRINDVLSEFGTKIAELQSENTELREMIFLKGKIVEELNRNAANTNSEMKELMNRLHSTEKELKIRSEEKVSNCKTSNSTQKLHLENVKKIAKLESECERLRVLLRKRLPGPTSMTTKKNKLQALEEDNNALRMKLTIAESQLEELLSKTQITKLSDFGCDDKASCAWSSASTMISDLTTSNARSLEINLMDDFVEMEKLASVCDASGLSESVSKLIQIIEKFNLQTTNKEDSDIHVFQWKSSEAAVIIQSFLHVCYGLLNGEVDIGRFSWEVGSILEWIINHCISVRDESIMKDEVKKQVGCQGAIPLLHIQSSLEEEIGKLKEKIREEEEKLEDMVDDNNSLSLQLQNKILENENVREQFSVAKIELDDVCEKLLSLQVESEYKTKCFEGLETRCNELQIQLKSMTAMDIKDVRCNEDGNQLQTNWDVTSVSEKLAKCQETIFSLGKQLNEMQECQETITPKTTLLHKLLEEDKSGSPLKPPAGFVKGNINPTFETDWIGQSNGFRALPVVPVKKKKKQMNGGMLKKMVWRKRKGKFNKLSLVFSTC